MSRFCFSIITVAASFLFNRAEAEPMSSNPEEVLQKVASFLETGDSFQAMEYVETLAEPSQPVETAKHYSQLVRDLYAKQRDVPGMILIGRAGIACCLREARRVEAEDAKLAEQLRGAAKTIAYNLSVNAWPGWGEEGIEITRADSLAALDVARLNLRLARELDRNAEILGNAHWLLGAQHLALGQTAAALEQFELAEEQFQAADKPDYRQMARGYAGITRQTEAANREEGGKELAAAIQSLNEIGTDDARFFAAQLEEAAKHFPR
jgi:hypothetical protein